ncbi:WD40 repeat domain-containing protein [Calothrix sp. 336/3]|uniref:WD40 repeat domain-containing protein n=1 Tax=Calothrix sp. 336/3 TaxID=1337936 RepID=UPI0004E3A77B|nr:WD40 repeat domain-containing protein [Calothrix sp. 336/3]AKG20878.1 WD40 repeat-containing protein [Calothrix sp. 336/3]
MDWISLLKAQQADFLQRVKKPKTYDLSLLESPVKGCHSEIMAFWGEPLGKILETVQHQAEIMAKSPPPTPPEYPEPPEWVIPFPRYFQQQAEDYLLREEVTEQVMTQRWGKMMKKVPQNTLEGMLLDDEGNLRGESKFPYVVTGKRKLNVLVCVADGESFNGIKKDKVKWSITQDDVKNYHLFIFLCLFYPFTGRRGYEKRAVITGFLPKEQIDFSEPKILIYPSNLLYSGGVSWYLEAINTQQEIPRASKEVILSEVVQTVPTEHPLKKVVGDWECWQTLKGHSRGINCLAFSPGSQNGKAFPIVASGSRGETKLWDLSQGELIDTLLDYPWTVSGLVDEVNALAFSPDGQTLVSGGADSTIKLWHTGARDLIDIMHKHNGIVRCVTFTPDGRMLATGGDDRKILFWDLLYRQVTVALSLDDTAAHSLVLSPDGQILVTGSYRKIKVWHLEQPMNSKSPEAELKHTLMGHSHIVTALAMSSDRQILVSGSKDKMIKIWHLGSGELLKTLPGHIDGVCAIALSPNGQTIASGSADKTIKLWHLQSGELLGTFTGHTDAVTALAFTTSGEMLVSGSLDKTIKIWQRS